MVAFLRSKKSSKKMKFRQFSHRAFNEKSRETDVGNWEMLPHNHRSITKGQVKKRDRRPETQDPHLFQIHRKSMGKLHTQTEQQRDSEHGQKRVV